MYEIRELIDQLRSSEYIRERRLDDVSSFNFTHSAFYGRHWDELTTKARGLFINTKTAQIVARGYDKFFNIDENPDTTMEAIRKKVVFPVEVYKKENGFLGLISWDHEKNDFFFATKSMISSPYVDMLKRIFYNSGIHTDRVADYLSKAELFGAHVTMIVEVIDPINDPHIIEYEKEHLVLLDIVSNTIQPHFLIYPSLHAKGIEFGIGTKHHKKTIISWGEIAELDWYCKHPLYVDENKKPFEGYVLRDSNSYMFKIKTAYYLKWKLYRRNMDAILNGIQPKALANPFLSWVENNKEELTDKSIIEARNLYEADSKKL